MKRLIYQVAVGPQSNLYKRCIKSVKEYCDKHDITHVVQTVPQLMIKPDPFTSNRSDGASRLGYLPIFEKENAFDLLDDYDQIAIIDADIFIRETAPNIFEHMDSSAAFGAVVEREMPISDTYRAKIRNYSAMQYGSISHTGNYKPDNKSGFEFHNMGMIVINSKKFKPYLKGMNAKQFLTQPKFKAFIDGQGTWKWSTDQTLLNYWIRLENMPICNMDWTWNALYKGVRDEALPGAHFIHFFLKDKLPEKGENVKQLMKDINEQA